jgi:hypothetical protein
MKKRMLALTTAIVMAFASVGIVTSVVSQASDTTTTQTPKKCKKCKKVIKKAKKCKKSHNTSAKCKKLKKKARKCKKTLKSRTCKKPSTKPTPSASGSGGGTSGGQEVTGTIQQPAYFVDADTGEVACYSGKHRRGAVLTDGANQGVDGWHFEVDPKTIGAKFTLTPEGGEGTPDLDIDFYTEFGTPEQLADPMYAPVSQGYNTREAGGETGTVPQGMKLAIVCMLDGANVPFTYKTGTASGGGGSTASPSTSPSATAIP